MTGRGSSVAVIVVNHRQPELLMACLRAIRVARDRYPGRCHVTVVDNASGDGSPDRVRAEFADMQVIELAANRGLGGAVNHVVIERSGVDAEWLLLVDNDAQIAPDAITELVRAGDAAPDAWCVAAQLRFAGRPDLINSAGIVVDRYGVAADRRIGQPVERGEDEVVEVFGASTATALIRTAAYRDLGGIDEAFFYPLEDVDLAWRARMRGWRCLYQPAAVSFHHHGATTVDGSRQKFFRVGRNRVRLLARNATTAHLVRHLPGVLLYDGAYVLYAAACHRTLAPLRGRYHGLRDWAAARRSIPPQDRRAVPLAAPLGLRAARDRRLSTRQATAASANRVKPSRR